MVAYVGVCFALEDQNPRNLGIVGRAERATLGEFTRLHHDSRAKRVSGVAGSNTAVPM
jgi:hypothetical protein